MDTRRDRYLETFGEILKLSAPINKICRFSGIKDINWGCTASHLEIIRESIKCNYDNILIFEDDFKVTSFLDLHKNHIKKFLERKYDYDICFLSCNANCLNIDYDDLLCEIRAYCTTTSGYFISKQGMEKLLPIWENALIKFKETGDHSRYACDMSWRSIQNDGKVYIFKNKIGYQRPQIVKGNFEFYEY